MSASLKEAQKNEIALLKKYGRQEGYIIDRDWLAPLADPYILMLINSGRKPKIIEIGCGSGESIKQILSDNQILEPSSIAGTSLTELPEHALARELGVTIHTGIMAEELPSTWTEQFDLVMACMVMMYTELTQSVPEILRIIKPNGHFIGYDNRMVTSKIEEKATEYQATVIRDRALPFFMEIQSFTIQKQG